MEEMNQKQHRTWASLAIGVFMLSAVWAAWNRNTPAAAGSLGIGLALALFYLALRSKHPQFMRWFALGLAIVGFLALILGKIQA